MDMGKVLVELLKKYNKRHRTRIQHEINHPKNSGYELIDVETISINDLLGKHNIADVDLCSIDTEGGELEILRAIDFSRFNIDILIIENNYYDLEIRNFMFSNGYHLMGSLSCDEIYKFNEWGDITL